MVCNCLYNFVYFCDDSFVGIHHADDNDDAADADNADDADDSHIIAFNYTKCLYIVVAGNWPQILGWALEPTLTCCI